MGKKKIFRKKIQNFKGYYVNIALALGIASFLIIGPAFFLILQLNLDYEKNQNAIQDEQITAYQLDNLETRATVAQEPNANTQQSNTGISESYLGPYKSDEIAAPGSNAQQNNDDTENS